MKHWNIENSMKTENLKLKIIINNWDFSSPDWESLPKDFPNLSKKSLTIKEEMLLDGICLAWMASEGRNYLIKRMLRRGLVAIAIIFVLLAGGNLITSSQTTTNTVSAKTVTQALGEIVESTRSAILRK